MFPLHAVSELPQLAKVLLSTSAGPAGYAAIHGCENDTVTFFVQGGQHNLVEIATYGQGEHQTLLFLIVPNAT